MLEATFPSDPVELGCAETENEIDMRELYMKAIELEADMFGPQLKLKCHATSPKPCPIRNRTALHDMLAPVLIIVATLALSEAQGETLLVGSNQPVNFSLTVPTNQAVVIYGGHVATWEPEIYWQIRQFGETHYFRLESTLADPILTSPTGHPNILAGPLVLELMAPTVTPFDGAWISYEVLPLAGLTTLIVPPLGTNRVAVPSGTNFRLVGRISRDLALGGTWQLVSGSARAALGMDSYNSLLDMEFSGPIDIEIGNTLMESRWFTYSLHSGSVQALPEGVIAASGVNALSVEESSDLANWSTAVVIQKGVSPMKYYRLKVSR